MEFVGFVLNICGKQCAVTWVVYISDIFRDVDYLTFNIHDIQPSTKRFLDRSRRVRWPFLYLI